MDVLVQPLNRTIRVAPGANLLEALRMAQIPLSHSCKAGRCGTCRCRLIDGEVLESGREQQRPNDGSDNYVFACQTYITEHCTIEIPDGDEVVVHPARIVSATVIGLEALTHDVQCLMIKCSKPIEYSPGQYVQVQFATGYGRPYSMAGLCGDDAMEFHIRHVPGGRVSGYVASELKVGDRVKLSGPLGSAYLRRKHDGPILCVADGTGLAPALSMLRGTVAERMRNPIHFYLGVRSPRDLYGLPWLDALREQHPALNVQVIVASRGDLVSLRGGLVTQAIEQDLGDLSGWRGHLYGSPSMVEATTLLARRKGIDGQRIHSEAFYIQGG
jgi:naphthalene 1,2-dioxygenase ferredoxin reductase component